MTTRKFSWFLLLAALIVAIVVAGCSSKKFTNTTTTISDTASPTVYIPLDQGWRINYTTLEPETEHHYIEVSDPVTIDGNAGFTIRRTNLTTLEQSFTYMYATTTAIYESSSTNSPGEKILESPFIIGNSWERSTNADGYGDTTSTDDPGGEIVRVDANPAEYTTMRIVAKENISALDGHIYGNCLKVEWQVGEYAYIYFWYAAGIGLVKYESVPNSLSAGDNNMVTVMSDYAQIVY